MKEGQQLLLFETVDKEKNGKIDESSLDAARHPYRYESHKYWGRKPHNIVIDYIKKYSTEGDTLLDPFMGSGVAIVEGLILSRNVIGIDLNPIACFIAQCLLLKDIDLMELRRCGLSIIKKLECDYRSLYRTKCKICDDEAYLVSGVWKNNKLTHIYYRCAHCGSALKKVDSYDLEIYNKIDYPNIKLWYPTDSLPKNADRKKVYELFTPRNLLILAALYDEIKKIEDDKIKNILLYTFTANVAFTSIIIPINEKRLRQNKAPTGIWGFKRFWVPPLHVENNVFRYFKNRLERTIKAKIETNELLKNCPYDNKIFNKSSTTLELSNESIDYIFTDPPFGNMIPYFNLSTLWNAWLNEKVDSKSELIYDQNHTFHHYEQGIKKAFLECYRVLKKGKFISVTFNNKNMKTWRALINAIVDAGFVLIDLEHAEDGEQSFTQTTRSKKGSLSGHFVYTFQKPLGGRKKIQIISHGKKAVEDFVLNEVNKIMTVRGATTDEIYKIVIPLLANNHMIFEELKENFIDNLLAKNFIQKEIITEERMIEKELVKIKNYIWCRKEL
ncbi:MAG: hypothetical protein A3K83_00200 [Omnitrophica WOR_2 bacterium RBG_13_44_8b]|nr:MAG: hypothetical protein A3K83_00200 [Omnitrophica WOR_2 bacterium RBG_13_44_8b]